MNPRGVRRSVLRLLLGLAPALLLSACGGGGGGAAPSSPVPAVGSNQMLVTVESYPPVGVPTVNIPYVTVRVCDASGNCRDIDHVVLDTGSYGLRVLQSALVGLDLPTDTTTGGTRLAECARFLGGYIWGGVSHATVQLGAETAGPLPIQVIGASGLPAAPSGCSNGTTDVGTLQQLQGNGLLGVGHFVADPGPYYGCGTTTCTELNPPPATSAMVSNPVALLASSDDNGIVLAMPAVPNSGAGTTYGVLSLGVGTQSDNAVAGFSVIPADLQGDLTVTLQGQAYPGSFLDSGSNFYFASLSGVPVDSRGNYIPSSLLNLPITVSASTGAAYPASLNSQIYVANYSTLDFSSLVAFNDMATRVTTSPAIVDLGMPYFYGKQVAYVINGRSSPLGVGPLYALH